MVPVFLNIFSETFSTFKCADTIKFDFKLSHHNVAYVGTKIVPIAVPSNSLLDFILLFCKINFAHSKTNSLLNLACKLSWWFSSQ